ncbi:MAG: DUF4282 domain-containing protein [Gammaproteobacteria bacterium]|nr:DUF4282 domain-containing protein [Gammaproteobacteria bacterium]
MDFLTFNQFISTEVLIIFYYLGAIVMPVGLWIGIKWLIHKYNFLNSGFETGKTLFLKSLTFKQQLKLGFILIICFLLMELFWRLLFEFLIAYMQIRDALLDTAL